MTKIKLCGMMRSEDISCVNSVKPEYIGFVFAKKSRRYITFEKAKQLKEMLLPEIKAVGVFVDEDPASVAACYESNLIDIAQLHGDEDEGYIKRLRDISDIKIIKAFKIRSADDIANARSSSADFVLLDSGAGCGLTFDWSIIKDIGRPYFLAGGLERENIVKAITGLDPYAVDISSGIETDNVKDPVKIKEFVSTVRSISGKG